MNNKELQDYLKQFPDDAVVSINVIDVDKKRLYPHELIVITDCGQPAMFLRIIGDGEDISAEIKEAEE